MSIWRKGPDGTWQVVVDIGINHPPLPAKGQSQTPPATKLPPGKNKKTTGSSATAQRQLLAAEKSFSATGKTQGTAAAYAAYLAPGSRLYRDQHAPYIGKKEAMATIAETKDKFTSQIAFSAIAASGDLGYTYGTTQIKNTRPEETQQVFTRIWQKQPDTSWKLILDVTKPLPPAKKE